MDSTIHKLIQPTEILLLGVFFFFFNLWMTICLLVKILFAQGTPGADQHGRNSYQYFISMWHTTGNLLFLTDTFADTQQTKAFSPNMENKTSKVVMS